MRFNAIDIGRQRCKSARYTNNIIILPLFITVKTI